MLIFFIHNYDDIEGGFSVHWERSSMVMPPKAIGFIMLQMLEMLLRRLLEFCLKWGWWEFGWLPVGIGTVVVIVFHQKVTAANL